MLLPGPWFDMSNAFEEEEDGSRDWGEIYVAVRQTFHCLPRAYLQIATVGPSPCNPP